MTVCWAKETGCADWRQQHSGSGAVAAISFGLLSERRSHRTLLPQRNRGDKPHFWDEAAMCSWCGALWIGIGALSDTHPRLSGLPRAAAGRRGRRTEHDAPGNHHRRRTLPALLRADVPRTTPFPLSDGVERKLAWLSVRQRACGVPRRRRRKRRCAVHLPLHVSLPSRCIHS